MSQNPNRLTTVAAALAAPTFAFSRDVTRAEALQQVYVRGAESAMFAPMSPMRLANLGKMWYAIGHFGIYTGRLATLAERRAIELLTEARRVAAERHENRAEQHATLALGLMHAG